MLLLLCCGSSGRVVRASNYDILEGPRFDSQLDPCASSPLSLVNHSTQFSKAAAPSAMSCCTFSILLFRSQGWYILTQLIMKLAAYNSICQDFYATSKNKTKQKMHVKHEACYFKCIIWHATIIILSLTLINKHKAKDIMSVYCYVHEDALSELVTVFYLNVLHFIIACWGLNTSRLYIKLCIHHMGTPDWNWRDWL